MTPAQRLSTLLAVLTLALSLAAGWHLFPLWGAGMPQWVRLGLLGAGLSFLFSLFALMERAAWAVRRTK